MVAGSATMRQNCLPLRMCTFYTWCVNGIAQYAAFCVCLSLSFFPRFIHVVAYITTASWDQNHVLHYESIYVAHFVDAFII